MQVPISIPPSATSPQPSSSFRSLTLQTRDDTGVDKPLSKLIPTFAVDVSGSTYQNGALVAEKNAIIKISDLLEDQWSSPILPWNYIAHPPCDRKTIGTRKHKYGTRPAALFEGTESLKILRNSPVWFLMTDGEIGRDELQKFTNHFRENGVHGIAAVVIVFGHRHRNLSPFHCNVSVGISVHGIAPHAIFLFHDIQTGIVSVFEAKGHFSRVIPNERRVTRLCKDTKWEDLVEITYDDLVKVSIPKPELPDRNVIKLPDGEIINMEDLYSHSLPSDEIFDFLGSATALDAMIITSETAGDGERLSEALRTALAKGVDSAQAGINLSSVYLRTILQDAFDASGADTQKPNAMWLALKQHKFTQTIDIESMKAHLRQEHRDTRARVKACSTSAQSVTFLEKMSQKGKWQEKQRHWHAEAASLRPTKSDDFDECSTPFRYITSPPEKGGKLAKGKSARRDPPSPATVERSTSSVTLDHESHSGDGDSYVHFKDVSTPVLDEKSILLRPNWDDFQVDAQDLHDCCICGEQKCLQMFLLRPHRSYGIDHERRERFVPFIFPITCCDSCFGVLHQMGKLPNGEDRPTEAVPDLTHLPERKSARKRWLAPLENVIDFNTLRTIWGTHDGIKTWSDYPLENFIQLIRLCSLHPENQDHDRSQILIWDKFFYELADRHLKLSAEIGHHESLQRLKDILPDPSSLSHKSTRALQDLQGTYLVPQESLDLFTSCFNGHCNLFEAVASGRCDSALLIFLFSLVADLESMQDSDSFDLHEFLSRMRNSIGRPDQIAAKDGQVLIQLTKDLKD